MVNLNPVLYKIIQAGLSTRSFAIVYDCPQSSLRNCIYGYVDLVPDTVKKSLVKAGFTIDNIDAEYTPIGVSLFWRNAFMRYWIPMLPFTMLRKSMNGYVVKATLTPT